ncbi:glycosyltransferase family 4 protein [Halosegnis longus]|uniref:glycosyltransferase family 4 protein n=1 Tax=Halosegnis longus TaxID=2216012 RepID=UPI00129D5823|nr:glycosyltransferase family 4 protein [Halosegnis longus]
MKIAFIHPSWPGDEGTGATHSATQTVRGLVERGHDVVVFCPTEVPDSDAITNGVETRYLGTSYLPQGNLELNHLIKKRMDEFSAFDIVHSYIMPTIPALESISVKTESKTVVTLNAYGGVCPKNDLLYLGEKKCTEKSPVKCVQCITTSSNRRNGNSFKRAASLFVNDYLVRNGERNIEQIDAFRAPSSHVKQNYVQFGFPENRINVIPHILDEDFLIEHQSRFNPPYQLLYVGSLERHKGVDRLIPILEYLQDSERYSFELTIVGDGAMRGELIQSVREAELDDIVTFAGFVSNKELPEIYSSHDIFLYPGRWDEPLARVYLEALATGTPIISTEYGSISDIIGDGGETASGDTEEIALTIENLIDSGLQRYSNSAQTQAKEFKARRILPRIEQMYKDLLSRKT